MLAIILAKRIGPANHENKDYRIKKEEISRPLRPKLKTSKTLPRQTEDTDNLSEVLDGMSEDSFSMTYSEEEKKEVKKKCEIS